MKIEERRAPYTNVGTLCGIMDSRSNSSARQLDKGRNPRSVGGPTGPCMLLVKGAHRRCHRFLHPLEFFSCAIFIAGRSVTTNLSHTTARLSIVSYETREAMNQLSNVKVERAVTNQSPPGAPKTTIPPSLREAGLSSEEFNIEESPSTPFRASGLRGSHG